MKAQQARTETTAATAFDSLERNKDQSRFAVVRMAQSHCEHVKGIRGNAPTRGSYVQKNHDTE